jgi:DNA-binding winged helix-turn-helix (wHTH) protein
MRLKFTPTQQRIINLLSDGKAHDKYELLEKCMEDELASVGTLAVHICNIRKQLHTIGEDILCVFVQRKYAYRHVRLINSPHDGNY